MSPAHHRLHALWRERWREREAALVAFVVPHAGASVDADELRLWLANALPPAMLPARIVPTDTLPRTPAGKVDRKALRLPAELAPAHRPAVAPRNPIEARVVALYAQVLGATPQSVDDDFFAHLGGHSLLATQLGSLIRREWPIAFELRTVFEQPTVAGLAAAIQRTLARGDAAQTPIPRRPPAFAAPDGTAA